LVGTVVLGVGNRFCDQAPRGPIKSRREVRSSIFKFMISFVIVDAAIIQQFVRFGEYCGHIATILRSHCYVVLATGQGIEELN